MQINLVSANGLLIGGGLPKKIEDLVVKTKNMSRNKRVKEVVFGIKKGFDIEDIGGEHTIYSVIFMKEQFAHFKDFRRYMSEHGIEAPNAGMGVMTGKYPAYYYDDETFEARFVSEGN